MGQKKKFKNKQNYQPTRKTTIQQINYTQQLNVPTNNMIDINNIAKSIQLKKNINININMKKPPSRKSRCISIKQTQTSTNIKQTQNNIKQTQTSTNLKQNQINLKQTQTQTSTSIKNTCTSVKQTLTQPSQIKYKQLIKRFQQLKNIQEKRNKSKSKSSKSILQMTNKSRSSVSNSKQKNSNQRFNLTALMNKNINNQNIYKFQQNSHNNTHKLQQNSYNNMHKLQGHHKTQFNSRIQLTHKVNQTLKKMQQNEYFDKDQQDSLIPFISISQMSQYQQHKNKTKQYQISTNEYPDDQINISEMRKFCKTLENQQYQNVMKKNINYFKGDQFQMMAIKIQRAWKRYKTKKLVQRYADIFYQNYLQQNNSQQQEYEKYQYHDQYQNQNQYANSNYSRNLNNHLNQYQNQVQYAVRSKQNRLNLIQFNNEQISKKYQISKNLYLEQNQNNSQQIQNNNLQQNEQSQYKQNNDLQQNQQQQQNNDIQSNQQSQQQNESEQQNQNYLQQQLEQNSHKYQQFSDNQRQKQSNQEYQDAMIKTQQLYPQNIVHQELLVTYISNLDSQQENDQYLNKSIQNQSKNNNYQKYVQQQSNKPITNNVLQINQYEKIINQIKINQLQKWKEIIHILQSSKNKKNPIELQNLLSKLTQQSQKNKKQLEIIQTTQIVTSSTNFQNKKNYTQSDQYVRKKRQASGPSQNSDLKKQQLQFDSRKYIQYLDSDMFIFQKDKSSQNSELLIHDQRLQKKISARKQKHLLAILNTDQTPIRLRKHTISKSQNLSYLFEDQNNIIPVNPRLSKCISEKNIQKVIRAISPQINFLKQQEQQQDHLNLDLIRQQFLQNADPIQQLEKLHSNTQLKRKIKESRENSLTDKRKQDKNQQQRIHPVRISLDISKNFGFADQINDQQQQYQRQSIRIITNQQHQINVQNMNKNIQQDQHTQQDQKTYKTQNVYFMIFNYLIFQLLKDMASYDSILQKFKQYSQSIKIIKKQTKKGFSTTHHQVKTFVDGLIAFLNNNQPQVFKNLQVPAGPTAIQMLNYLHPNQQQQQISEQSQDQTSVMVIPSRLFQQYWHNREKSQNTIQQQNTLNYGKKKQSYDFLKGLNKIFCRSIFDSFGQCLDFQRNFGQAGKPYPWKKSANFYHKKTQQQIQKSIQQSKKRMHEIATTYCGLIIQKSDMAKISMQGSDDYINHVQQDRMSRMLAQDLIQNQQRWVFYDDQELELLVEVSNIIVLILIVEASDQISRIF